MLHENYCLPVHFCRKQSLKVSPSCANRGTLEAHHLQVYENCCQSSIVNDCTVFLKYGAEDVIGGKLGSATGGVSSLESVYWIWLSR